MSQEHRMLDASADSDSDRGSEWTRKSKNSGWRLFGQQFRAILKKNLLLKAREWKASLVEVVLPVMILMLLVMMRGLLHAKEAGEDLNLQYLSTLSSPSQPANVGPWLSRMQALDWKIAMMPQSNQVQTLQSYIMQQNLGFREQDFSYFESSQAFQDYIASSGYPDQRGWAYLGIQVKEWDVENGRFDYVIRANASSSSRSMPRDNPKVDTIHLGLSMSSYNVYKKNGVLDLQLLVDEAILNQTADFAGVSLTKPQIDIAPFPTPAHRDDTFASLLGSQLTFLWILAFVWPVTKLSKLLVEEKEKRMKEGMKMMGLSESALWLSWIATYTCSYVLTSTLACFILSFSVFEFADASVIWLWLFLYQMALMGLCFVVASLFTRARTASTFSALIYMGLYFVTFAFDEDSDSAGAKQGAAIFSAPAGLSFGASVLANYESNGGITWGRLSSDFNGYSTGVCLGIFVLNIVLYFLLAMYLNQVIPNEGGVKKPVYFCCLPSFWCRSMRKFRAQHHSVLASYTDADPFMIEDGPQDGVVGVKVQNLRKVFPRNGTDFVAVNNLSLDLYEGQIVSLLGHNGAGKTTSLSMLNGLLAPTSGTAHFYGKSLQSDLDEIRRDMGVCPQHDILFDSLTVQEHLELFASIKGLPSSTIGDAVKEMITMVGLTEKANTRTAALSGGQKRKLSVGIALLGDSRVIFLDEPTSGMDPYSRRWTWNLLKEKKKGRVIILTTHFMEEADYLGDRIAIMAKGQIQCCGSSLFLKDKYGVGYTLTVVKKQKSVSVSHGVEEMVKTHVSEAEVMSNVASEISFRLPLSASANFPGLFEAMESQKAQMGIDSYGISVTTLEEVFLRVGHAAGKTLDASSSTSSTSPSSASSSCSSPALDQAHEAKLPIARQAKDYGATLADGSNNNVESIDIDNEIVDTRIPERSASQIFRTHFRALFIKRFQNALKDRKMILWQIVYPTLILFGGIALLRMGEFSDPPPFPLDIAQFRGQLAGRPLNYPVGSGDGFDTGAFVSTLSSGFDLEPELIPSNDVPSFAQSLLASRNRVAPRYLALFAENNVTNGAVRYVTFTNTTAHHGLPTSLAFLSVARLRNIRRDNGLSVDDRTQIVTSMQPMPLAAQIKVYMNSTTAFIVSIAFAFIPAAVVMFVVKERETKVKHQQVISGVSTYAYWLSNFAWDALNFVIPVVLALIILAVFDISTLVGSNVLPTMLGMVFYTTSILTFTYCLSFLFDNHASAQNVMLLVYILTGTVLLVINTVLPNIDSARDINKVLQFFYRLLPNFCLGELVFNLMTREASQLQGRSSGLWDMEISGYPLLYMMFETFVYFGILFLIEKIQASPDLLFRFKKTSHADHIMEEYENGMKEEEDEDVVAERERLINMKGAEKDMISVEGVRKVYPGRNGSAPKYAVKNLWMGIPQGECFGFLGINGAGKTTTLRILTGDELPTKGTAHLSQMDILTHQREVRRLMGYCPQFDALLETLTARQHLVLFARIKGVAEGEIPNLVDRLIRLLQLDDYADQPAGSYSGGNKRKLCVGIALIGNPPIVFLDEPSTGMDPGARRFMWNLISTTMKGRSVILTTHSMEECEALCGRIGIMVSGRLRCLGSAQHLKQRFGKGYQLELNCLIEKVAQVKAFVLAQFPGSKVLEHHDRNIKFNLPRHHMTLANIFRTINNNRASLSIAEYSVSEATLEQIFLFFAKQQDEERDKVRGVEDNDGDGVGDEQRQSEFDPDAVFRQHSGNVNPSHYDYEGKTDEFRINVAPEQSSWGAM